MILFTLRSLRLFFVLMPLGMSLVSYGHAEQFSIATNNILRPFPQAAFDGTNYLIGLQIIRQDGTSEPRAQLVSSSGAMIGSQITTGHTGDPPKVGFDGVNYILAWADYGDSGNGNVPVVGQMISASGALIGSPFQLSQSTKVDQFESICFGKTNFLVTWADKRRGDTGQGNRDIYGRFISPAGVPQGGDFKISGVAGVGSSAAFDGTNFLVVWRDDFNDTDIIGRLISPAGPFVTQEFLIDGNTFHSDNEGTVIFDGARYFVTLGDEVGGNLSNEWDIFGRFVTTAGTVAPDRIPITTAVGSQILPSTAFDGTNYLVAWVDGFGSTNVTTKARFLNSTGAPMSSEFTLSAVQEGKFSLIPSLLFDGRRYLAVVGLAEPVIGGVGDAQFTKGVINGIFVNPLPRGTFPIGITSSNESAFHLAFDGTNYLVGIQGGSAAHDEITAQLFSPTGVLIGARITTGRFGGTPSVAFDGTNYLMVWEDVADNNNRDIYGQFINPSGSLVRAPFAISSAPGNQLLDGFNHLHFDGSNYFVVWRDERNGHLESDIYGQLVTPSGTLLGSEIPIAIEANMQFEPAVGFDGTNFLIAYQARRTGPTELYDTYGKLVSRSGVPGSAFLISQNPSPRFNPTSLAFDGTNYLVVWARDTDLGPNFPNQAGWDVYGRLVTRFGSVVGNELPIATGPGGQPFATVIFAGNSYLVSWIEDSDGRFNNRFFNRAGMPLTAEFSLFGSQGRTRASFGSFLFDGARLVTVTTLADDDFSNGDVYGLILPPPRIELIGPRSSSQVSLRLNGMPGVPYAIQATENSGSASVVWTTLTTSNALTGTFNYTDTGTAGVARRFYRAVQP